MAEPVLSEIRPLTDTPWQAPSALRILSDSGDIMTAEMSVDQWLALPDHPRQRDTERHARARHWRYAKRATGAARRHLAHVTAACWDNTLYKVNGHTRAYLWAKGDLPAPDHLHVTIHKVATCTELNDLYAAFDASWAAKPEYEKVYGGLRECGLELTSLRLKRGFLADSFNMALRGLTRPHQDKRKEPLDVYKAVAVFKEELRLLDSVNPPKEVFQAGVIAAALLALSLYPDGLEFWRKLALKEGNKQNGLVDPVEIVLTQIDRLKRDRASWTNTQQELLCGRALAAFLAWEKGRHGKSGQYWFKTTVHAVDLQPLITQMKAMKGISDDLDL